jgi:hypothetical protein
VKNDLRSGATGSEYHEGRAAAFARAGRGWLRWARAMAIQSLSEFEAVLGQVVFGLDKVIYERGEPPKLKEARRSMQIVLEAAPDKTRLKAMKDKLSAAAEVVRLEVPQNEKMNEQLWDLIDYIDYCV